MDFDDYQEKARQTANYPDIGAPYIYPVIGLAGESGELANKIKKIFRDDGGVLTAERKAQIEGELGDILWYVAQIATELHLSLSDVAEHSIEKLQSRLARGTIVGSGDMR